MSTELIEYNKSLIRVKTERDLPPHITFEEFKRIYYDLSGRDQLLCGLLWETGGRISDVLNLKWKDIDLDAKIIRLFVDKRDITITIPFQEALKSDLRNWMIAVKPPKDGWLFPSKPRDGRITRQAVDRKIKKWGAKLGKSLHAHMWRHGIAIHLLANGVNIKVISARLGHANVFTTMNYYLVVTPELQRDLTKHVPMR